MILVLPIALYVILLMLACIAVVVIVVGGYISLLGAALFARFRKEPPLPPPPFEPYTVYLPRPGCGGCGMAFLADEEHFCRWCGTQREYQEIEIAYKGNLKRLNR